MTGIISCNNEPRGANQAEALWKCDVFAIYTDHQEDMRNSECSTPAVFISFRVWLLFVCAQVNCYLNLWQRFVSFFFFVPFF